MTAIKTGKGIEIIDGRQRYETLLKFCNNEFALNIDGLEKYKDLKKLYFDDLSTNFKKIIREYKMPIIYYTVRNYISISNEDLEYMKRDLFRRYNYGNSPLRASDIYRARYCYDKLTIELTKALDESDFYDKAVNTLLPKNKRDLPEKREKINHILIASRKAIIIPCIPIIGEKTIKLKKSINRYYDIFAKKFTAEQRNEKIIEYKRIVNNLYSIKEKLEESNCKLFDNVLFYESMYWMFSILYNAFPNQFYKFNIDKLCHYVKNYNQDYFEIYSSALSDDIIKRYEYAKEYMEKELGLKLDTYLNKIKENKEIVKDIEKRVADSNSIILKKKLLISRETLEIKELIRIVDDGRFKIQPIYQRGEVKDCNKASKIIESIILGVKLPPIYVYVTEKDNLDYYTVLDRTTKINKYFTIYGEINN